VVEITFVEQDGTRRTIDAPLGLSMMKAAVNAGIEAIVAECGGNCACGTCRIYVPEQWRERLPGMKDSEREMLDFTGDATPGVRLSCQIAVTEELAGLEVATPESQY